MFILVRYQLAARCASRGPVKTKQARPHRRGRGRGAAADGWQAQMVSSRSAGEMDVGTDSATPADKALTPQIW